MATPPVVFLDIDGVLNITRLAWKVLPVPGSIQRAGRTPKMRRQLYKSRRFAVNAVKELDRLLFATAAVLVLSSSWRLRLCVLDHLAEQGVTGPWHEQWRTDEMAGGRGAQIDRWLAANGNPDHVILDDWPYELQEQRHRLVLLDDCIGLTPERANAARDIIMSQRVNGPA